MEKRPCVYITASDMNGTLYIGVTSNIHGRMARHAQGLLEGFTQKYRVTQLVYYGFFETMPEAIKREKQLKKWNRLWKIRLIESMNADWKNLFDAATGELFDGPADAARRDV